MTAYLQIDLDIQDLELFMTYVERIPAFIERHGGRYLVQGVEPEVIEAHDPVPARSVILEFPSQEHAKAFLAERKEAGLDEIWGNSTRARILLLEGARG